MDFEKEKNYEEKPASEQSTSSRDGYPQAGNGFQRDYRGRSPRPRIHSGQRPAFNGGADRPNYSRQSHDDGGFRPEGFGAGLQGSQTRGQGGSRPRPRQAYGRPQEGEGYNNRGYGQPRFGYNSRSSNGGYQQPRQQGGYRPRYNQDGEDRGYQKSYRPSYGKPYSASKPYQPSYNNQNKPYGQKTFGKRPHAADYDPNAKYSQKKRIEYKEVHYDPNEPLRLNKFLANAGVCSRREADEFIQAGVVSVNGQVVTELGTKILRTDEVRFHDQPVSLEKKVYVLLNKPKDYVTTSDDPQQRKTVMDLVKNACPERIYPVGRLDRNTTGVLLLTNDGDLASKLTHPKYLKKKIYHVFLDKNVTAHDLHQISDGIQLEDGEIKADDVQYADAVDKKQVGIEIHSGKNRIVRRIFESLGYKVLKLDRVQFAGLTKKNLRRGDWRYLTEEEVDRLRMGAYE